jgi:hypothetical protein
MGKSYWFECKGNSFYNRPSVVKGMICFRMTKITKERPKTIFVFMGTDFNGLTLKMS